MKTANCHLRSLSPYSPSRHIANDVERLEKESHDAYEKRTWREKAHFDEKGRVYIPPMAFKQALSSAASFLSEKIKGKGQATWSKHFLAGVHVLEPVVLPIKKEDLIPQWIFAHADGKRGSGKRVMRCFPLIPQWEAIVPFSIFDLTITEEIFEKHLREAGNFIGVGRFRCQNGGFLGRFKVEKIDWN